MNSSADLKGVKLVYMGDARYNMGNSLMIVMLPNWVSTFVACAPEEIFPESAALVEHSARSYAKESRRNHHPDREDVKAGTKDADVICTDVWVSMGEPDEVWEERIRDLTPYKVTSAVMEERRREGYLPALPAGLP